MIKAEVFMLETFKQPFQFKAAFIALTFLNASSSGNTGVIQHSGLGKLFAK